MSQIIYNQLVEIVGASNVKVGELMKNHTTFRIGGEADYYVLPSSKEVLKQLIIYLKKENIPYYIIGNGSNLLVGDLGFRGVIIQLASNMSNIASRELENGTLEVTVEAGTLLSKLAMNIANLGYRGFEFAAGIPGTLGGAVAMNAGAYGGEIKDAIISAEVIDQEGNLLSLSHEQLELGYRTSVIQKEHYIVVEAKFIFDRGNKEEILNTIHELNKKRREKQPLEYPSAGSTFKRPEGFFAGKLIMDAGLRGYRVGNIMVSEKHCGFVVNVGDGTAKEVKTLMENVQKIVKEKYGVTLEPEVRMIGQFDEY